MTQQSKNLFDLSGRVAVVTGAANGIGRATALTLAASGAKVFAGDVTVTAESQKELAEQGVSLERCDVTDLAQLQHLIDRAAREGRRLDILCSNAGINMPGQITEIREADWDRCLQTNLKAAFFGVKFALPHFLKAGGGSVVNTASNAGILPRAHDPVYSISKLALVGLTRSLALCHSKDRVRVNCVCPGPVDQTTMMETDLGRFEDREEGVRKFIQASPLARALGRMVHPEEVAQSILYLCSDAAQMVTGTAVTIDGGKALGVPPVLVE